MRQQALAVVKGVLLWLAAFTPGAVIGGVAAFITGEPAVGAVLTQILFIATPLALARFPLRCGYGVMGFRINGLALATALALLIATGIAALVAYVALKVAGHGDFKYPVPGLWGGTAVYIALAFALAPAGEETLFRGLLLGYMLDEGVSPWVAIAVAATLFSLIHVMPFSKAPLPQLAVVVGNAFLMSTIAGYLRKQTGSLLPSIATHIGFNLGGFIAASLTWG